MASIKERLDKEGRVHFQVQVRLKGCPHQTETFLRKTDAKRWAAEMETRLREGRFFKTVEAKKRTLRELIDKYLLDVLPHKKSRKSQEAQLRRWQKELGHLYLCDVTSSVVAEKRDVLLREMTPRKKKRSPASVVRYLAILSHVFSFAIRELQWLDSNPVSNIRKPTEPRGRVRVLSSDERERLLNACKESKNKHLYLIVILALFTGMRAAEILHLRWQDIDLKKGTIIVHQSKNNERRSIPLTGKALKLVRQYAESKKISFSYLFASNRSNRPVDIRTAWRYVLKRAKIENMRMHDCRHDFASNLLASGASTAQLAEVLGHRTLQMVKRYSHLCEGAARGVVSKMTEEILG